LVHDWRSKPYAGPGSYSSGGTGSGIKRTPSALLRWKLSISAGELAVLRLGSRGVRTPLEHACRHLPHILGAEQVGGLQGSVEFLCRHTHNSLEALMPR
jgi:hypothetical protein